MISVGNFGNDWQEICDYASGGQWAPEQVEIGYQRSGPLHGFVAGCGWRTAAYLDQDDKYSGIDWWGESPWATLSTGTNFPFPAMPSAQIPRVPWTFANLRVFVVGKSEGSPAFKFLQTFWEELAELPVLEVILMKQPEPRLVMQFLRATLMCEKKPARLGQAENSTRDPVPQPFPALKALIICALGKLTYEDLRISKLPTPKGFNALSSIEIYLRYIAQKLRCWRDYGSKYMRDLYFYAEEEPLERENYRESEMLYDELDDETLRMLGDVAVRVVFGEVLAWDREKEGEEEDNESPDAGVATTSSADEKKGE
ncbi:hypothetical protein NMY22_g2705 [Coprinellus aureogranulatus]|nr:hypothetical protein NMY22_g2705 [Coprinellus aureogranulatus]